MRRWIAAAAIAVAAVTVSVVLLARSTHSPDSAVSAEHSTNEHEASLVGFPSQTPRGMTQRQWEELSRSTDEVMGMYLCNDLPEMLNFFREKRQSAPPQWDDTQVVKTWYERHEWFFSSCRLVDGSVTVHPVLAAGVMHPPATLAEKVNFSEQLRLTGLPFQPADKTKRIVYEVQVPMEYTFADGVKQRVRFGVVMEWDSQRSSWISLGSRIYDIPVGRPVPNVP
jgi:hypothetical protein